MSEARIKGGSLRLSFEFVEAQIGSEAWQARLKTLSGDTLIGCTRPLSSSWYPLECAQFIWDALVDEKFGGDPRAAEPTLREVGRVVAEANLSTIYRAFLMLARPETIIRMLPRMWTTYFDGIIADSELVGPQHGRGTVRGLGSLRMLAPVASGWLSLALEKSGGANPVVREAAWERGEVSGDPLEFTLHWS
jgi:hypothetical protein